MALRTRLDLLLTFLFATFLLVNLLFNQIVHSQQIVPGNYGEYYKISEPTQYYFTLSPSRNADLPCTLRFTLSPPPPSSNPFLAPVLKFSFSRAYYSSYLLPVFDSNSLIASIEIDFQSVRDMLVNASLKIEQECSKGIYNINFNTLTFYYQLSSNSVRLSKIGNSIISNATKSSVTITDLSTYSYSLLIGVGAKYINSNLELGKPIYLYGPSLLYNRYVKIDMTTIAPTSSPYSLQLNKSFVEPVEYTSQGFSNLQSFQLSHNIPNLESVFALNFPLYDWNGTQILVKQDTISCLCSKDGVSFLPTSIKNTYSSLECTVNAVCKYLSVIGNLYTPIQVMNGQLIETGSFNETKLYTIRVPSGSLLSLTKLQSNNGNVASIKISTGLYDYSYYSYDYPSMYYKDISIQMDYTSTCYIRVEPKTSKQDIDLTFVVQVNVVPPFPIQKVIIWPISIVIISIFCCVSSILIFCTIRRNSHNESKA